MADLDFSEYRYWTSNPGSSSARWSEERTEQLKDLHAKGLSSSQIAQDLGGGLTRNAVIGKVHRLGLHRDKPRPLRRPRVRQPIEAKLPSENVAKQRRKRHTQLERQRWRRSKQQPHKPVAEIAPENPIGFFELQSSSCRWPVGEATGINQLFCGALQADNCSYCETHARKAYYPAPRLREAA